MHSDTKEVLGVTSLPKEYTCRAFR